MCGKDLKAQMFNSALTVTDRNRSSVCLSVPTWHPSLRDDVTGTARFLLPLPGALLRWKECVDSPLIEM